MNPIISPELPVLRPELMQRITAAYLRDEGEHIAELLAAAPAVTSARMRTTCDPAGSE